MKQLAAFVMFFSLSAAALADGRLEGQIGREGGRAFLKGAEVTIPALGLETATRPDGRFFFGNVPAGEHTVKVTYLGLEPATQTVVITEGQLTIADITLAEPLAQLVVYGQAGSTASALSQQRSADGITSIVSSDEFGQLPDANLSEALQRIPGVFLERDQGEGRFVGIRGIDPNLNVTNINGVVVPSPESGSRAVALDVIPTDLLETLEVRKSFTPDMDPAGIGGSIDVRSLSGFDRPNRFLKFRAENSYNELEGQSSPKVALTYSDAFDLGGAGYNNFAVAAAVSWFDRDFGSDNVETGDGWPTDLELPDGQEFTGAEEIEQRDYNLNRERFGLALNLDFLPTANSELYLRTLYSEFSDQEFRTSEIFVFDDGDPVAGTNTSATWEGSTLEREMKDRLEEQEILSVVLGGTSRFDSWTFDYSYGYSYSEEVEPGRVDSLFALEDVTLGYTGIGETPDLVADPATFVADNYVLDEITLEDNDTNDEQNSLKLDLQREFDASSFSGYLKFGAKFSRRDKENDQQVAVYDGFPGDPSLSPFVAASPDYDLNTFGPGINAGALRAFVNQNLADFEIDADDTLASSIGGDYELTEDVDAFYLMSRMDFDRLRLVYGVRFEQTDFTANGQRIVIDDVNGDGGPVANPVSFSNDYDFVLPSVNLRYEVTPDLIFRAAYYESFGRPAFEDLSPGGEIEFEEDDGETELQAELGNPLLEPLEATNFDLSIEYYDQEIGVLSAGLFYKDLENFVVLADVADRIDLTEFVGQATVDDARVIQPINGDSADLLGLELAWVKRFTSLPSPWNGLMLSANATFTDSEASLPERDSDIELPRQSDTVMNLMLGYENARFSSRIAATYKSEALLSLEDIGDPAFDVFQDDHLQVDLSLKYNINNQWQVYFDANNVTDEPFFAFFGDPRFNAQFETYGRTFALGLQYRAQ